jgi:hypothetical protein
MILLPNKIVAKLKGADFYKILCIGKGTNPKFGVIFISEN